MGLRANFALESELLLPLFWLLAGILSTLAALILLLPWLRTIPRLGPLPAVSWPMAAAAAVALAVLVGLYEWLGRPDLAARPSVVASANLPAGSLGATGSTAAANGGAESMSSAIASLEARLAKGSGTADDWELLAQSYQFLGRPADAAKARAKQMPALPMSAPDATVATATAVSASAAPTLSAESVKRLAEASAARRDKKLADAAAIYSQLAASGQMNADSWADYADTAASLQGSKLAGEPETFIARSLALDPQHPKALWLKASADEEAGRWNDAVLVWQKLETVLEPRSADAKIVVANLQHDLKLAASAPTASPAAAAATISGEVALADALSGHVASDATLFVVAKSVDSPGIPLAVLRTAVGTWPVKFTLDDSQAMLPGRNLSSAGRFTIEARISRSGQAMPASGDLQGTSGIINPSAHEPLKILIDRVVK
jgi:cytochrome c-type biogenesis protein CcmH